MNSEEISNTKHIYALVDLCARYGVGKAVVCPGSRCAPLLIGFGEHPVIETVSLTDERSAGFVGLGLAQQSGKPVVLVCTSGTAAQNFAPAVTEAFYQQVPLIIMTADRPPEWIDQWDGQAIHQDKLYAPHVKGSFVFDENHSKVGEKALALATVDVKGPVHVNIPIREPFYPTSLEWIVFATKRSDIPETKTENIDADIWIEFESLISNATKVMVLGGQMDPNPKLTDLLNQLEIPVVGDVISNLHGVRGIIKNADLLFNTDDESFAPELLITLGRSVVSKNMKLYLRKYKPNDHWHVGLGMIGDPFQSLTKKLDATPDLFFKGWLERTELVKSSSANNYSLGEKHTAACLALSAKLAKVEFNHFSAVKKIIKQLPRFSVLHLGNSMPVRIANFIGLNDPSIEIWSNRGTSGIDGVVSTAVGHALAEQRRKHTLIVGDLSFFYDRNGLWLNEEFPTNLQIVVLNDGGGGIFCTVPGAIDQGALDDLFTTPHARTAVLTAKEFGLNYRSVRSMTEIIGWEAGIMEIFTDMERNMNVYKQIIQRN